VLAFDSSIGRVNYLTGVSVDTRMWDHSYFHRSDSPHPALRRNPGAVGALPASSIAAHIREPERNPFAFFVGLTNLRTATVHAPPIGHDQNVGRYTLRVGFSLAIRSKSPTLEAFCKCPVLATKNALFLTTL
ncbi:MAG: hypothetical protein ACTHMB_05185, partial [Candidatus Binatia bacterium]